MAKARKIRTQYNYNPLTDIKKEVNNLPSQTVPDQSMTVRQLIDRYSRGLNINQLQFKPVWYDEDKINEFEGTFDHLTKQERIDTLNAVRAEIKAKQEGITTYLAEQKEAKKKARAIEKAKPPEPNPNEGKEPRTVSEDV